jgi:hypothetical protein
MATHGFHELVEPNYYMTDAESYRNVVIILIFGNDLAVLSQT